MAANAAGPNRPYNMTEEEWSSVDRAFRLIAKIKRRLKAKRDKESRE